MCLGKKGSILNRECGCLYHSNVYRVSSQAIGLLIGMEDVPPAKQSDYLSSLLTPLCQQVVDFALIK